ncbi:colanic acid biosynthesis acetyltransferase WcaF [Azotobacter chroococcum]|uniref:putative colanic acid biosynthesis acetyltransferase n=1 Tax=Azotobacter chroococcum TaxID=353 RepID=UPI00103AC5B5|nr:putative colanic acid biosynthesis acetyltransferase [Azotobacter chroococcum]TBW09315.1 colanic acid biosynthesis acetyltransferase WcaF [Azotobacter chroococcum]
MNNKNTIQDLNSFRLPHNFRGRSAFIVQLWWIVESLLFKKSPQFAYPFRRWLLRLFGAKIGHGVIIRPSVTTTYPWKLTIGNHAWIGDDVVLYNLGDIHIGDNAVVSQGSYLCTGDHDYTKPDFPIRARPITIDSQAWVASQVFVSPGVRIGKGAVIGARSSVFNNMPPLMLCLGSPCKPIKKRIMDNS